MDADQQKDKLKKMIDPEFIKRYSRNAALQCITDFLFFGIDPSLTKDKTVVHLAFRPTEFKPPAVKKQKKLHQSKLAAVRYIDFDVHQVEVVGLDNFYSTEELKKEFGESIAAEYLNEGPHMTKSGPHRIDVSNGPDMRTGVMDRDTFVASIKAMSRCGERLHDIRVKTKHKIKSITI